MTYLGKLAFLALSSAAATCASPALSQGYPQRTVNVIVPFGAGSLSDIMARIVAEGLRVRWNQQVVVENRPGVAGTAAAAKATPDGYTLMITSNGHAVIGQISKNLTFDPIKDFVGITRISSLPMSLVVTPDLAAKSVKDVIKLAKDQPGKLNFSSPGLASTAFLAGALFRKDAQLDIVHLPLRSAPEALTAVIRGDAHLYFAAVNLAIEQVQGGKIRAIAVATPARVAQMPTVPTFRESGFDFVYDSWFGLMAPAKLHRQLIEQLNRDTVAVLTSAETKAKLEQQAATVVHDKPGEFDRIIASDTSRMVAAFPSTN